MQWPHHSNESRNRKHRMQLGGRIPPILIRVINAVTLSANEEELRAAIKRIAEKTELDKFFAYAYGAHHFWLTHRRLSNGEPKEYRLLKVEF